MKVASVDEHTMLYKCRPAEGNDTCRYVVCGIHGFECAKHTTLRVALDARGDTMVARGDNCEGIVPVEMSEARN